MNYSQLYVPGEVLLTGVSAGESLADPFLLGLVPGLFPFCKGDVPKSSEPLSF